MPLEPFLQGQLERFNQTADPSTFNFTFYFSRNPITNFTGGKPYFELSKAKFIYGGTSEAEAIQYGANEVIRNVAPNSYELYSQLDPQWEESAICGYY